MQEIEDARTELLDAIKGFLEKKPVEERKGSPRQKSLPPFTPVQELVPELINEKQAKSQEPQKAIQFTQSEDEGSPSLIDEVFYDAVEGDSPVPARNGCLPRVSSPGPSPPVSPLKEVLLFCDPP